MPIVHGDLLDTECLASANLVGWLSSGWRRTVAPLGWPRCAPALRLSPSHQP
jgi:hypothetical protein